MKVLEYFFSEYQQQSAYLAKKKVVVFFPHRYQEVQVEVQRKFSLDIEKQALRERRSFPAYFEAREDK